MNNNEIRLTELYGKDSVSSSRIVINDNFRLLEEYINSFIEIIDPISGTMNVQKIIADSGFSISVNGSSTSSEPIKALYVNKNGQVIINDMTIENISSTSISSPIGKFETIRLGSNNNNINLSANNGELLVNGQPIIPSTPSGGIQRDICILKDATKYRNTINGKKLFDIIKQYEVIYLTRDLPINELDVEPEYNIFLDEIDSVNNFFKTIKANTITFQITNETNYKYKICFDNDLFVDALKVYCSDSETSLMQPDRPKEFLLREKSSYLMTFSYLNDGEYPKTLHLHIDVQENVII